MPVKYQGSQVQQAPAEQPRPLPEGVAYQPQPPTWAGYRMGVSYQGNGNPTWKGYQQGVYAPPPVQDYTAANLQAAAGQQYDRRRWSGMPYWLRRLMVGAAAVSQVPAQYQMPYTNEPPTAPAGDA